MELETSNTSVVSISGAVDFFVSSSRTSVPSTSFVSFDLATTSKLLKGNVCGTIYVKEVIHNCRFDLQSDNPIVGHYRI